MTVTRMIRILRILVLLTSFVIASHGVPVSNNTADEETAKALANTDFKPSIQVLVNGTEEEPLKKRGGRLVNGRPYYPGPVRKFDRNNNGGDNPAHSDYPHATVVHHYHGEVGNGENASAGNHQNNYYPAVQSEELRLEKPPRLYYGDFKRQPTPSPQASVDYMDGDDGKDNEEGQRLYYYPKNLLTKPTAAPVAAYEYGPKPQRGRQSASNGHNSYASQSSHSHQSEPTQPGQSQLAGQISVSADIEPHGHGYREHYYHHPSPIGPVIGRALQLLIPSAILFTGASALFPNRVHVPTNDPPANSQKRSKRSVPTERRYDYGPRPMFDEIPSAYLRPEHRSDDEGIELYEDDDGGDYFVPSSTTSFGERMTPEEFAYATPMPSTSPTTNIPPSQPTSTIPIIQANKMVPMQHLEAEEPEQVSHQAKNLSGSGNIARITKAEVMSKLLMATVSSKLKNKGPAPNPTESTPVATTTKYSSVIPQIRRYYTGVMSEKPLFRPLSTVAAKVISLLPSARDNTEAGSIKNVKREIEQGNVTSTYELERGPKIIQVGRGGDIDVLNATFYNRTDAEAANEIGSARGDLDLAPDSPVVGLITNFAARESESPVCQKRALCELAIRGSKEGATKFERFLWNLASLVPPSLSTYYDLKDTFSAVQQRNCSVFPCANPNLDLQELPQKA